MLHTASRDNRLRSQQGQRGRTSPCIKQQRLQMFVICVEQKRLSKLPPTPLPSPSPFPSLLTASVAWPSSLSLPPSFKQSQCLTFRRCNGLQAGDQDCRSRTVWFGAACPPLTSADKSPASRYTLPSRLSLVHAHARRSPVLPRPWLL